MPRKKKVRSDDYTSAFPVRLREIMSEQGKTQQEVADAIGKTRQAIGYYADGSSSPDWKTVVKLAQYFSVSTDWLLGITAVKSCDTDMKQVCDYTGLSEGAIEQIIDWKYSVINSDGAFFALLNQIFMSGSFHMLMYHLHNFRDCAIAETAYWKLCEKDFPEQTEMRTAEGKKRKDAFCTAIEKMVEETAYSSGIKDKILAFHQIWDGGDSYRCLHKSIIDVDGFSLCDVYEYRASKELPVLLSEIRDGACMSVNER